MSALSSCADSCDVSASDLHPFFRSVTTSSNLLESRRGTNCGRYHYVRALGHGSFGAVYLAEDLLREGEQVAVKLVSVDKRDKAFQSAKDEAKLLQSLSHENILEYKNMFEYRNPEANTYNICIVTEFCSGGDLNNYLVESCSNPSAKLTTAQQAKLMMQAAMGLDYLHSKNVAHRDLKPGNMLIDASQNLKIADFGLSKDFFCSNLLHTRCGTSLFMAPEVIDGMYGRSVDIFSLGLVFLCIMLPHRYKIRNYILPYTSAQAKEVLKHAMWRTPTKTAVQHFNLKNTVTSTQAELLNSMLRFTPQQRLTAGEVIEALRSL